MRTVVIRLLFVRGIHHRFVHYRTRVFCLSLFTFLCELWPKHERSHLSFECDEKRRSGFLSQIMWAILCTWHARRVVVLLELWYNSCITFNTSIRKPVRFLCSLRLKSCPYLTPTTRMPVPLPSKQQTKAPISASRPLEMGGKYIGGYRD